MRKEGREEEEQSGDSHPSPDSTGLDYFYIHSTSPPSTFPAVFSLFLVLSV